MAVVDSGLRLGWAGRVGGKFCMDMVAVAELELPIVYPVPLETVTVRLPALPTAVVGMEMVLESDDENDMVPPVAEPWLPVHAYVKLTVTFAFRLSVTRN